MAAPSQQKARAEHMGDQPRVCRARAVSTRAMWYTPCACDAIMPTYPRLLPEALISGIDAIDVL
jgi:hypothetical protein